eukprot:2893996-Pyramimonas_sp.AAC.1
MLKKDPEVRKSTTQATRKPEAHRPHMTSCFKDTHPCICSFSECSLEHEAPSCHGLHSRGD